MKLKIYFIAIIIILASVFSCDDNNVISNVCGIENPLEELTFLQDAKNEIDSIDCGGKSAITQYNYNAEIVFEVIICDQVSDAQTLVYNCAGEIVCTFGGLLGENTCPDFEKLRINKIVLYGN